MDEVRKINYKSSDLNPTCNKNQNIDLVNIFDTNLGVNKNRDNGFKRAIKLKRNFK